MQRKKADHLLRQPSCFLIPRSFPSEATESLAAPITPLRSRSFELSSLHPEPRSAHRIGMVLVRQMHPIATDRSGILLVIIVEALGRTCMHTARQHLAQQASQATIGPVNLLVLALASRRRHPMHGRVLHGLRGRRACFLTSLRPGRRAGETPRLRRWRWTLGQANPLESVYPRTGGGGARQVARWHGRALEQAASTEMKGQNIIDIATVRGARLRGVDAVVACWT